MYRQYIKLSLFLILLAWSFLFLFFDDLIYGVISLLLLTLCALIISNLELNHPLTWFAPAYFLYSSSLSILTLFNEVDMRFNIKETVQLEWIGLFCIILIFLIPFLKNEENLSINMNQKEIIKIKDLGFITRPIYLFSILILILYLGYVYANGLSTKRMIALDESGIHSLRLFIPIYVLCFVLLVIEKLIINNKFPLYFYAFNLLFAMSILLVIGERDVLLRVLIVVLFLTHLLYKKFKKLYIILLALCGLITLPILGKLKSALFDTQTNGEENSILYNLLSGEFYSASRNLNTLLNNIGEWEFFFGKTFLYDIERAFFNGDRSPVVWFNNTFHPEVVEAGGGYGFSIMGEGYINFGVLGLIIVAAILGFILKFLYYSSQKSLIWLLIYITAVPIFIYLIRADFANLLSQVLKQIIFPIAILLVTKEILRKATENKS
ncbi:hypothetical protein MTP04_07950 [Lysinibacillus sp. PLM2]|nr:hypothetical protein MTP04_07950 [Lysinibacillus sp. PLM2]